MKDIIDRLHRNAIKRRELRTLLATCDTRAIGIYFLRRYARRTLNSLAVQYGISPERVRQIEAQCYRRLQGRDYIGADFPTAMQVRLRLLLTQRLNRNPRPAQTFQRAQGFSL